MNNLDEFTPSNFQTVVKERNYVIYVMPTGIPLYFAVTAKKMYASICRKH